MFLWGASGCAVAPDTPQREGVDPAASAVSRPAPPTGTSPSGSPSPCQEAAMPGFDEAAIRAAVLCDVAARLGSEALAEIRSAPSSVLVTFHQGLPRPVQRSDGSWTYEGPYVNAAIRVGGAWIGWRGANRQPLGSALSAEIDRILSDPAFWREPAYVPPACTDAGARRLVVAHDGRNVVRQQSCGGTGLSGRLFRIVLGGD
jgi:hypothetical protein